ncbi:Plastocyanin-like domain [Musa troglodytarum]|uniref:Plastocyanin-like domain n=1 Tax=Musa troglodytarum TaxID=320322 RepID=A0A9E7K0M3_9LILI|nr:Plastocyanin-like domain [Musa troglodytarum]
MGKWGGLHRMGFRQNLQRRRHSLLPVQWSLTVWPRLEKLTTKPARPATPSRPTRIRAPRLPSPGPGADTSSAAHSGTAPVG